VEEIAHGRATTVYKTHISCIVQQHPAHSRFYTSYLSLNLSSAFIAAAARKLRPRPPLSLSTPLPYTYHQSAASAIASRPRASNTRLAQPHGLDTTTPVTSITRAVSMNQMLNCLSDDCCFLAAVQAPGYSCPRYQKFSAPHRAPGDFVALGLRDNTVYVSI
jgi:hypothetical protein